VGTISLYGPGGTLVVTGNLYLATTTGSTGATSTTGTLNLGGGTALINTLVADPTGASTVNLCGGTLVFTNPVGTAAAPLTALTLSPSTSNNISASLQIQVTNLTNQALMVNNLTIDGLTTTTNVIDLFALPPIKSYPVEIPLIQYTSFNEGSGTFNIGLGAFPVSATPYRGVITNDTTSNTIAVVVSSGPIPPPPPTRFNVVSLSGTTLTLSGTNGVPNGAYVVLTSTNLAQVWTPIATNNFSGTGTFSFSETYSSTNQARFYTIEQP
jgi:hypothetical protein